MFYAFESLQDKVGSVKVFKNDYDMYVSWIYSFSSNQGIKPMPMSINEYMALHYQYNGINYNG